MPMPGLLREPLAASRGWAGLPGRALWQLPRSCLSISPSHPGCVHPGSGNRGCFPSWMGEKLQLYHQAGLFLLNSEYPISKQFQ